MATIFHSSAAKCPKGSLDQVILHASLFHILELAEDKPDSYGYLDVPCERLVFTTHMNDWNNARNITWREALKEIKGKNWGLGTVRYFRKPMRDNHFPTSGSAGSTRFSQIGGVFICDNGVHRCVAGKAYLLNRFGDQAVFREVLTRRYSLLQCLRPYIKTFASKGMGMEIFSSLHTSSYEIKGHRIRIIFRESGSLRYYALSEDGVTVISLGIMSLLKVFLSDTVRERALWAHYKPSLLRMLLDSGNVVPKMIPPQAGSKYYGR